MTPLDVYVVTPCEVAVAGKAVAVSPLRVRQIPAFARHVAPVAAFLMNGDLLAAVAAGGEDMVKALAVATGEPEDWLGDLLPDEFVALAAAVMEVNADFFVRRVAPALAAAGETMKTQMPTAGETSSPSSSTTDTA